MILSGVRSAMRALGAVLVLAGAGVPAKALGDYVGVEPQYWSQAMEGTFSVDGAALSGSTVDVRDDLDLDRTDNLPAARVYFHWLKRNYLYATYFDSGRTGEKVLGSPLVFNDTVFLAGENVRSRVDTKLASLAYGFNFVDFKVVKAGFRFGADRLDFDGSLHSTSSGTRTSSSESVTFPIVGLGIQVQPLPLLRFTGEISGVSAHSGGDAVLFSDARVQGEIYLNHFVGFHGGYRALRLDVDLEGFGSADVTLKGPYAGVTARF